MSWPQVNTGECYLEGRVFRTGLEGMRHAQRLESHVGAAAQLSDPHFLQQLWHFQCPGLPSSIHSLVRCRDHSTVLQLAHPPGQEQGRAVRGGGERGGGKASRLELKAQELFMIQTQLLCLTLRRKEGNQSTGPDHVLGSSPSPNPLLPRPGSRWNGEVGERHRILSVQQPLLPYFFSLFLTHLGHDYGLGHLS